MADSILDAGLFAMVVAAASGVFTAPSFDNFLTLAAGWVLCRTRRTTNGLILAAGAIGRKHFGTYHRFFSQAAWETEGFWLGLLVLLVEGLCPQGEILLVGDDTVQAKSGRKISGATNWRNACSSTRQQYRFLWGHNWIILALAVHFGGKTYSLPICLRLYRKQDDCQAMGRPYRTRSQLLLDMVQRASEALSGRDLVLLVDGQYATRQLLAGLPRGLRTISRLRRDAALWERPPVRPDGAVGRPPKKGARLPRPEQIAADPRWRWRRTCQGQSAKSLRALWYGVLGAKVVKIVIVRQNNPRKPFGYFLCTDPDWSPGRIISTYVARWTIEITIRDAKQFAGLGQAQCRTGRAVERQAAFTLGMLSLVMCWYLSEGHATDHFPKRPWYRRKRHATFQDMLAHARRSSWRRLARGARGRTVSARSAPGPDISEIPQLLLHYIEAAA